MPVNALTRTIGLRFGPVVLTTFIKHYLARYSAGDDEYEQMTELRKGELIYDQSFSIIKAFLKAASHHTIEEVQGFSNTRTPTPPWVHLVRLIIPRSCCDEAAKHLINLFGGEDGAKRTVGGTKWWQVRGVNGVDAQWIATKKDRREAQKRSKNVRETFAARDSNEEPSQYEKDMDEMPCILYIHGGGYYFGSVDQERYVIQRYARKINGRVFAVNYRLAPQYPFPCALQDVLAAYLFLILPPTGAAHQPLKPTHIVIAGDSAGGGLVAALLQVLRDSGLPLPAGGVMISPWCDLTHSFPSVHVNTATDIMPEYGLCLHKPSTLWPPPSEEITRKFHTNIRDRLRRVIPHEFRSAPTSTTSQLQKIDEMLHEPSPSITGGPSIPINMGETTSPPKSATQDQTISLTTKEGELLKIESQVQFYAPNQLLAHPLVSPIQGYLGGLPPLFVIVGDGEVLRDEGIYLAHRAANPQNFPLREETKEMYPPLEGIENKYAATPVHLQVYDDAAHVLPVLFSFTTPAKYCHRAIATFCKYVTGRTAETSPASSQNTTFPLSATLPRRKSKPRHSDTVGSTLTRRLSHPFNGPLRRSFSVGFGKTFRSVSNSSAITAESHNTLVEEPSETASPSETARPSAPMRRQTFDVPSLPPDDNVQEGVDGPRSAGDMAVYTSGAPWRHGMIRERVSTQGVVRPLEPSSELSAFQIPEETVGRIAELSIRRYMEAKAMFDRKFAGELRKIERHRKRNMDRARKDTLRSISQLLLRDHDDEMHSKSGAAEGTGASWSRSWAINNDEHPPPSSIASRRDTDEARRLAKIADEVVSGGSISANNLWSTMNELLTVVQGAHPERKDSKGPPSNDVPRKSKLGLRWLLGQHPSSTAAALGSTE